MKILIFVLAILLFVSCGYEGTKEDIAEAEETVKERAVGFVNTFPDDKLYLGTEAAIKIVKDLDQARSNSDYDAMRPFLADTAMFYFADGRSASSADEFLKIIEADYDERESWTFDIAYSIDLNPETGGEHVQAGFTGTSIKESDTTKTYYQESYFIIEGKVITWNQYTQKEIIE
jgi:hypothetical protein